MKKICLAGYSGHGYVVAEIINLLQYAFVGYFDIEEKKYNPFKFNISVMKIKLIYLNTYKNNIHIALGVGDNIIRK